MQLRNLGWLTVLELTDRGFGENLSNEAVETMQVIPMQLRNLGWLTILKLTGQIFGTNLSTLDAGDSHAAAQSREIGAREQPAGNPDRRSPRIHRRTRGLLFFFFLSLFFCFLLLPFLLLLLPFSLSFVFRSFFCCFSCCHFDFLFLLHSRFLLLYSSKSFRA